MSRYPRVTEWVRELAGNNASLLKANKPIEALCQKNNVPYFINTPKL